jgi:hypothetical protein
LPFFEFFEIGIIFLFLLFHVYFTLGPAQNKNQTRTFRIASSCRFF